MLSVLGCTLTTIALIMVGLWIGNLFPAIKSLDSTSAGEPINTNLMWVPFALISLGIWFGFLSGYTKMKSGL